MTATFSSGDDFLIREPIELPMENGLSRPRNTSTLQSNRLTINLLEMMSAIISSLMTADVLN